MEIYKNPSYTPQERTKDLLSRMTVEEKIGQMCQVDGRHDPETWIYKKHIGSFLHVTGDEPTRLQKMALKTRLGIPILFGIDAIHGHAFQSGATVFPSQLGMSSSWNPELLKRVAGITACEVILTGLHWTFSPVLCIGRDARWGRIDETFGEDPYLIGVLATAMIQGYQGEELSHPYSILACAKHFAAYGETQGGRDSAESDVSERKLRSIFLPPFYEAVKAKCATFMAGYNAIDGVPCSGNRWLLHDVLKEEWGFEGFVVTDWDNIGHLHEDHKIAATLEEACTIALHAGNDMMMSTPVFYEKALSLVEKGVIQESLLDDACSRILCLKFELGLFDEKRFPDRDMAFTMLGCAEHRKAAYEAALESIVLLKNENNILPLSREVRKIALIGPNCDDVQAQLGDWSFGARELAYPEVPTLDYHPEYDPSPIVTILEAMKNRGNHQVHIAYEQGCDLLDESKHSIKKAVTMAKESDVVIAVIGDTNVLNGEMRDRVDLHLTGAQQKLLEALKATGKPLIVVLINGKPLTIPWIAENADAILEAWNPGMEGGNAVASILFGDFNPCGKLTISFPRHVGQQPVFYNQLPGWHGNTYVEMTGDPLFPFGFGLSYTRYKYSNLTVSAAKLGVADDLTVSVDVENIGGWEGTEIVQVYTNDLFSSVTTPVKELKGFQRVHLKPGEKKTVLIAIPTYSLALVNRKCEYVVEPGVFEIMVGSSSKDIDLLKTTIEVVSPL